MTYDFLSFPGEDHLHMGRANEDRIRIESRDGLTAAVVCDGAGSFGSGAEAAELISNALAQLLHRRFEALYAQPGDQVRTLLVRTVERTLGRYSRSSGIAKEALACTILAAAVHEDGRCICIHLGDGIILQKDRDQDRTSVVSCPMTGLAPHSTYLTMNCELERYLRFYRWQASSLERLVLLSDGAAEHLVRLRGGDGWVYAAGEPEICSIRRRLYSVKPRDDHSAVVISRIGDKKEERT